MKIRTSIRLLLATSLLTVYPVFAQDYDLVINNGRVIDPETLFDDVANVGIKDGRIVEISKKPLKGTETMDATGQIVAPGFIDTHFHFQKPIGYSLGLRDGLTSSMDLEMGCAGSYVAAGMRHAPARPRPTMVWRSATSLPARWSSTGQKAITCWTVP